MALGCARFAYVDFSDPAAVVAARRLSESQLDNRRELIKSAQDYTRDPPEAGGTATVAPAAAGATAAGGAAVPEAAPAAAAAGGKKQQPKGRPSPTVFVGNLSFQCTEDILRNAMSAFGAIHQVRLAVFPDTGRCKGSVCIVRPL